MNGKQRPCIEEEEILWTALPGGFCDGDRLRLSVFVSPRLYASKGGRCRIGEASSFMDWPRALQNIAFQVALRKEQGPPSELAQVRPPALADSSLWKSLFCADTLVDPFLKPVPPPPLPPDQVEPQNVPSRIPQVRSYDPTRLFGPATEEQARRAEADLIPEGVSFKAMATEATEEAHRAVNDPFRAFLEFHREPQLAIYPRPESVPEGPPLVASLAFQPAPAPDFVHRIQPQDDGQIFYADPDLRPTQGVKFILPALSAVPEGFRVTVKSLSTQIHARVETSRAEEKLEDGTTFRTFGADEEKVVYVAERGVWALEKENTPDFHAGLSALSSYPQLMRDLGLVIDLSFKIDPGLLRVADSIRVVPIRSLSSGAAGSCAAPVIRDISPWTKFSFETLPGTNEGTWLFFPACRSTENSPEEKVCRGMLIRSSQYSLLQLDVDGAIFKRIATEDPEPPPPSELPTPASEPTPPALRQAGIALVDGERQSAIESALRVQEALEKDLADGKEITLYAEDVVQGYHVDVCRIRTDGRPSVWRSLCQRRGRYRVLENRECPGIYRELPEIIDEGFISPSARHLRGTDSGPGELKPSPALFRWDGWSLSVERPGKAEDGRGGLSSGLCETLPETTNDNIPLAVRFMPLPGSLERLRFGSCYSFRARAVDLAGNSLTIEEADTLLLGLEMPEEHVFDTNEPFRRFEPVDAPRLVPLQEVGPGATADHLVIRSYETRATETAEWLLVPPKVAQIFAELHGVFDCLTDAGALYQLLSNREGDLPPWKTEEGKLIKGYDEAWLNRQGAKTGKLRLPYLPDPLSRGAVFRNLAGRGSTHSVCFTPPGNAGPTYPENIGSAHLRLLPGAQPPAISEDSLSVFLPPGRTLTVNLSSSVFGEDRNCLALWHVARKHVAVQVANCCGEHPLPVDIDQDSDCIGRLCKGQVSVVTPGRKVTFVHAVQRPLLPPGAEAIEFTALMSQREPAMTVAPLSGSLKLDVPSTGKLDVRAQWTEQVDDPGLPDWYTISRTDQAFQVDVPPPLPDDPPEKLESFVLPAVTHKFQDTRHRRVAYQATATSRFVDYYDENEVKNHLDRFLLPSRPKVVNIPSTAQPAEPKVSYVVPTFVIHENREHKHRIERIRKGGGLRIYMERGWFSSGDGELLGVILPQSHYADLPDFLRGNVTQWGADPIWRSEILPPRPILENFRSAVDLIPRLPLRVKVETSSGKFEEKIGDVAVAAYEVFLDQEKDLLYCDIDIEAQHSYFPFVRLALARYQPCSLNGYELSAPVRAEFIQLTPDRTLTIKRERQGLSVLLAGDSYTAEAPRATTQVVVMLEKKNTYDWIPIPGAIENLKPRKIGNAAWVWSGNIRLETKGAAIRLVVKELEEFLLGADGTTGRRLVFAERIYLSNG
jgi:hypothetical protein